LPLGLILIARDARRTAQATCAACTSLSFHPMLEPGTAGLQELVA
jgi:hypothetical protein